MFEVRVRTQKFLRDVQAVVAPARRGSLSFEEITHVVEEVQEITD